MFLVDSHCHLDRIDLSPYAGQLGLALDAAQARGVGHFLNVSIGMDNFPEVLAAAKADPRVHASVGIHPNEQGEEADVEQLCRLAQEPRVIAIGETGLDYFRSQGDLSWQHARFRRHIAAARESGLPLIIHCRDARADTLRLLREERAEEVGGIMHCFVEDWETAQAAMEMGFYISLSGIVTFRNALELKEVAKRVPLERLLLETDSPYLAPIPHRGKPNYPAYVRDVADYVAELREMEVERLAEATTQNFARLFNLELAA